MYQRELHSNKSAKELQNDKASNRIETPKKRYIFPEERQQIIDELRLVPKKVFLKIIDELRFNIKRKMHISKKKTTNY